MSDEELKVFVDVFSRGGFEVLVIGTGILAETGG